MLRVLRAVRGVLPHLLARRVRRRGGTPARVVHAPRDDGAGGSSSTPSATAGAGGNRARRNPPSAGAGRLPRPAVRVNVDARRGGAAPREARFALTKTSTSTRSTTASAPPARKRSARKTRCRRAGRSCTMRLGTSRRWSAAGTSRARVGEDARPRPSDGETKAAGFFSAGRRKTKPRRGRNVRGLRTFRFRDRRFRNRRVWSSARVRGGGRAHGGRRGRAAVRARGRRARREGETNAFVVARKKRRLLGGG